jgi:hypothetical protein
MVVRVVCPQTGEQGSPPYTHRPSGPLQLIALPVERRKQSIALRPLQGRTGLELRDGLLDPGQQVGLGTHPLHGVVLSSTSSLDGVL